MVLTVFRRNARVHTLHDASRWKYYFLANYVLNGVLPPRQRDTVMTQIPDKEIILNAFDMNCVGHINHGLSDTSTR